jgi:hypothetical protein
MAGCGHNEERAIKLVVVISSFGNEKQDPFFLFSNRVSIHDWKFFIQDLLWD